MEGNELGKVKSFECPLCSGFLPIRIDKKRKPYVICPRCGIQMFVRYEEGIERLKSKTVIKRLSDTLH